MKKNPQHYKINVHEVESKLEQVIEEQIRLLQEYTLIETVHTRFRCSELGSAMARYYIKFETMKKIIEIPEKAKTSEIVRKSRSTCI